MTTQIDTFFSNLEKCPYALPEGIKEHLVTALKATYGEGTTVIAQKKPKQETGYNFFVKEKTAEFKKLSVASDVRMKQIRELWHKLGDQGKDEYTIKAGGIVKPKTVKIESPTVAQETAVVKTEVQVAKDESLMAPKVEAVVAKTEAVVAKTEAVVEKATVAVKKVAILKAKVEAPIAKAEEPVAKVETPIVKVEPVIKAVEPVAKIEAPAKKVMVKKGVVKTVETPATAPVEAPVAKIEAPVAKTETPVVANTETPVVAKVPIVKTGAGYNHFKKIRTEELKTQEKGLSGADRVTKVNAEWKALSEAQKVEWTEKATKA
jgi:hypothetical protein